MCIFTLLSTSEGSRAGSSQMQECLTVPRIAGASALTPYWGAPVKTTHQTPVKTLWSALGWLLKIMMSRNERLSLSGGKALSCKVVETGLLFSVCLISTRKKIPWRMEG